MGRTNDLGRVKIVGAAWILSFKTWSFSPLCVAVKNVLKFPHILQKQTLIEELKSDINFILGIIKRLYMHAHALQSYGLSLLLSNNVYGSLG